MTTDWLVLPDKQKLTPNRYHAGSKPHLIKPIEALVLHYTASGETSRTVGWLCNPASKASAHFVVGKDGDVYQLAPLSDRTWHAGGATSTLFGERNVNGRTIGIEIVNWGVLTWDAVKQGWLTWPEAERKKRGGAYTTYAGPVHPDPKQPKTRAWEPYPDVQMVAVCELITKLAAKYPVIAADPATRLVGHEDVDAMRKQDPGKAFQWKIVRDAAAPTP